MLESMAAVSLLENCGASSSLIEKRGFQVVHRTGALSDYFGDLERLLLIHIVGAFNFVGIQYGAIILVDLDLQVSGAILVFVGIWRRGRRFQETTSGLCMIFHTRPRRLSYPYQDLSSSLPFSILN
jgi:hypothetical protein